MKEIEPQYKQDTQTHLQMLEIACRDAVEELEKKVEVIGEVAPIYDKLFRELVSRINGIDAAVKALAKDFHNDHIEKSKESPEVEQAPPVKSFWDSLFKR